jgi:toxin ParE1/3/4
LEQWFSQIAANSIRLAERIEFDPPVRIMKSERHLIVYVLEGNGILIVRILHESMNLAARISDQC